MLCTIEAVMKVENYLRSRPLLIMLFFVCLNAKITMADVSPHLMDEFDSMPVNLVDSATPLVMINASVDHQLFHKAYDDYSDLDGDGVPDTTYTNSFDYYGYFDSYKCYAYDSAQQFFAPMAATATKYCEGSSNGYWSGNFLNWVSMARIDAIRKMLFGGHRRVDSPTTTVLERTYLPHDAHSWAKHYEGDDLEKLTPFQNNGVDYDCDRGNPGSCSTLEERGITLCNTTDVSSNVYSQEVASPPLIKAVKGNYSLWAANDRWQCTWQSGAPNDNHSAENANNASQSGIYASASNPTYSEGIGRKNYVARIEACVSGLLGQEKCKQYPDGNYKPIGLLQVYGDEDLLHFGMMAGSYNKHTSGGVLISQMGSIANEVNTASDGTFSKVASSAGGPIPGPSYNGAAGVINAWSLYRIVGYDHGDGKYAKPGQGDNCDETLSSPVDVAADNRCQNWGNPFSEIYLNSIRYLAGLEPNGDFRSNASPKIAGLGQPLPWDAKPVDSHNYCAPLHVVNFNTGVASYDGDELDGPGPKGVRSIWSARVLPGNDTAAAMTDVVGAGEGIHGNPYFIGETNIDNQTDGDDGLCTAKTVSSLGSAGGLCPDAPGLQGSYRIAGLAYYAHTHDISTSNSHDIQGEQTVDTYAVNAPGVPEIVIPHPLTGAAAVTILPACRNTSISPMGNCALVDFKIVEDIVVNNGSGVGTGKLYVNWEASEQGGDYDQDMWGTITYTLNGNTDTLTIATDVIAESTMMRLGFGYVLSGTTRDGFHAHSGIAGYTYDDPATIISGADCVDGCQVGDGSSTAQYIVGSGTARLLEDPLWYAAKWGGFRDRNGNRIPDLQAEWDRFDTTGNPTPDNIPDTYFTASNPVQLEDSLNRVFLNILQRTSSGTAAAVVSNNVSGVGAIYQAYFEPLRRDAGGNQAKWVGTIQALWLDSFGLTREDDGDGILEDYDTDPVVETYFDPNENRTRIKRWTSSRTDDYVPDTAMIIELDELNTLWNAREQLNFSMTTDLSFQRSYSSPADNGRYIKTWIDADRDGVVDIGEYRDFTAISITPATYGFLDVASENDGDQLVNYIRGQEIAGYRNRTVDYDGDGTAEVMRLGDVVNSTPTLVSDPQELFDLLYRDSSYSPFRKKYGERRHVLYAGGNDGMLHAFNAGFYDHANQAITTRGKRSDGATDAVAHPLGSELWAYVPFNLLPHLKWLKDEEYSHVYYVDGKPRIFDAKIFNTETACHTDANAMGCIHPNGWGTVMVVGMGLGGGTMHIDTEADGFGNANDMDTHSAYSIFDITDPEEEPVLLGEIPLPDRSFSVTYPAVMTFKDRDSALDDNKWFLIFGSGPELLDTVASTTTAKLYILDLEEISSPGATVAAPSGCALENVGAMKIISCDTGAADSFIGSPVAIDWNLAYKADTVYFGITGNANATAGSLMRLAMNEDADPANWGAPQIFVNTARPVTAAPIAGVDEFDNHWLYFGTGRLYGAMDKNSTSRESLYGVKDLYDQVNNPLPPPLSRSDLINTTNVEVLTNGTINNGPNGILDFAALENFMDGGQYGWYIDLPPVQGSAGSVPATRVLSQPALIGGVLFCSVYQPSTAPCIAEGLSQLYGLYYKTGTGFPDPNILGTTRNADNGEVALPKVHIGWGRGTASAIHSSYGQGDDTVSIFNQLSTGTIIRKQGKTVKKVRTGKNAWRQKE